MWRRESAALTGVNRETNLLTCSYGSGSVCQHQASVCRDLRKAALVTFSNKGTNRHAPGSDFTYLSVVGNVLDACTKSLLTAPSVRFVQVQSAGAPCSQIGLQAVEGVQELCF